MSDPSTLGSSYHVDGWDTYFYEVDDSCKHTSSTKSLAQLFVEFFDYYGYIFNWQFQGVSLRNADPSRPVVKGHLTTHNSFIIIEDPFDTKHNLAQNMSARGRVRFIQAFRDTAQWLRVFNGDLHHMFQGGVSSSLLTIQEKHPFMKLRAKGSLKVKDVFVFFSKYRVKALFYLPEIDHQCQCYLLFETPEDQRAALSLTEQPIREGGPSIQLYLSIGLDLHDMTNYTIYYKTPKGLIEKLPLNPSWLPPPSALPMGQATYVDDKAGAPEVGLYPMHGGFPVMQPNPMFPPRMGVHPMGLPARQVDPLKRPVAPENPNKNFTMNPGATEFVPAGQRPPIKQQTIFEKDLALAEIQPRSKSIETVPSQLPQNPQIKNAADENLLNSVMAKLEKIAKLKKEQEQSSNELNEWEEATKDEDLATPTVEPPTICQVYPPPAILPDEFLMCLH
jgi:hypothetical protein